LISDGYVKKAGENQVLTAKVESSGGEAKKGRFGDYPIWPKNFIPGSLSK
tara:strand:+ start:336 stop:485 length:150 start_codon:yes stop_codon:yes gene_type:complete